MPIPACAWPIFTTTGNFGVANCREITTHKAMIKLWLHSNKNLVLFLLYDITDVQHIYNLSCRCKHQPTSTFSLLNSVKIVFFSPEDEQSILYETPKPNRLVSEPTLINREILHGYTCKLTIIYSLFSLIIRDLDIDTIHTFTGDKNKCKAFF